MNRLNRKTIFLLLAVIVVLLSAGCSADTQETDGYRIFCVNQDGTALKYVSYIPENVGGEKQVNELLTQMKEGVNRTDCKSVFPERLSSKISTLKDGRLTLDFSASYHELRPVEEILLRAAVVQTVTQVADVKEVIFTVEGEALLNSVNEAVGPMDASTFLNTERENINSYQYGALQLYFGSKDGRFLVKQMRNIHYAPDASIPYLVVEQVIAGPAKEDLIPVFAPDTEILDVRVDGDLCTVDFGSGLEQKLMDVNLETALYAVVNSLCDSCEEISRVQFSIEGNSNVTLQGGVDLAEVFSRRKDLIFRSTDASEKANQGNSPAVGVSPDLTGDGREESRQ